MRTAAWGGCPGQGTFWEGDGTLASAPGVGLSRPWLKGSSTETGLGFERLQMRGQRSRWGSCSAKGTISLNYKAPLSPSWAGAIYPGPRTLSYGSPGPFSPLLGPGGEVRTGLPRAAPCRQVRMDPGAGLGRVIQGPGPGIFPSYLTPIALMQTLLLVNVW